MLILSMYRGEKMRFVLAGALAAVLSWVGNRAALKIMGTKVIIISAPLLEELAKSGSAVLLGTSVILTHGIFGLVEALYDAWGSGTRGLTAGAVSFTGHLLFGYISQIVLDKYYFFFAAIMSGYLVHMLWNIAVMKFIVTRRRSV